MFGGRTPCRGGAFLLRTLFVGLLIIFLRPVRAQTLLLLVGSRSFRLWLRIARRPPRLGIQQRREEGALCTKTRANMLNIGMMKAYEIYWRTTTGASPSKIIRSPPPPSKAFKAPLPRFFRW
ncbi:hypothetical protein LINPERPRIM_LOCUS37056 [Linum perenne]